MRLSTTISRILLFFFVSLFAISSLLPGGMGSVPMAFAQSQVVPNFWHPSERIAKPDLSNVQRLRFLTTTDFPPFNFIDRNKRLTGFHVDLARAICSELDIMPKCQIQALPWDELQKAMEDGEGEAIIAGLQATSDNREKYEFSRPYLHIPARFVARTADGLGEPMTLAAVRNRTGLVRGSVHADWFRTAYPNAQTITYETRAQALDALQRERVDLVFSDALSLSFWLVSEASKDCCSFAGGPYIGEALTGPGLMIAFAGGRTELAAAADYALKQINEKGVFAELYLRYFPLGLY
ncbi:MAG: transporter substrate-binding domain-containing protein [Pseudomonadota bacterium]